MSTDDPMTENLAGQIDFQELINDLDLSIVAIDPDWMIQYANQSAISQFLKPLLGNQYFWNQLRDSFRDCLEESYKRALLGQRDQLHSGTEQLQKHSPNLDLYENVPLEYLEQKPVSFEFRCKSTGEAYSAGFDLHRGNFIFRIENITDRVNALFQAEKNKEELEEALNRVTEARNANPLTGLPGNITIQKTLRKYLERGEAFALIYVDLDYFKPYNDRYGFERGNEVLLFLRDILEDELEHHPSPLNFLGHIGGDDFVIITGIDHYEPICQQVIQRFDEEIPDFYNYEDREGGGILTKNRQGEKQQFSFMTISLAVVKNDLRDFDNYLEMTEEVASVKKLAKKNRTESCYRIDRRGES